MKQYTQDLIARLRGDYCQCDTAYTGRGLQDPTCESCSTKDERNEAADELERMAIQNAWLRGALDIRAMPSLSEEHAHEWIDVSSHDNRREKCKTCPAERALTEDRECQCATYCMLAAGAKYDPPIRCRGLTEKDPGAHPTLVTAVNQTGDA